VSDYLIAAAVTLIVVDFFLTSEFLSVVAYALIATVVTQMMPVSTLYAIAAWVVVFGVLLIVHFQVLRALSAVIVDKYIAPTKVKSGEDGLVDQAGTIREISGKRFVKVGDQLCEFVDEGHLADGDVVTVTGSDGLRLIVSRKGE